MELLGDLGLGFATALSPFNLLYCFIGVALGTAVGVLPGLGPIATIAMLLPITFGLPPVSSLIMLAGIYYGAQYGGSTTAILINLPGEAPVWSPRSTAIRWRRRAAPVRRWPRRRWGPSSPVRWPRSSCHRGAAAGRRGAGVRPGGILLADGAGLVARSCSPAFAAEGFTMIVLGLLLGWSAATWRPALSASPSTCRKWPTGSTSWR